METAIKTSTFDINDPTTYPKLQLQGSDSPAIDTDPSTVKTTEFIEETKPFDEGTTPVETLTFEPPVVDEEGDINDHLNEQYGPDVIPTSNEPQQQQPEIADQNEEQPTEPKSNKWVWIILIIIVAVLATITVSILYKKKSA